MTDQFISKKFFVILFITVFFGGVHLHAQSFSQAHTLQWSLVENYHLTNGNFTNLMFLKEDGYQDRKTYTPWFIILKEAPVGKMLEVSLSSEQYEPFDAKFISNFKTQITGEVTLMTELVLIKKRNSVRVKFIPIRLNPATGKPEKLVSFNLDYKVVDAPMANNLRAVNWKSSSVLANGDWYKLTTNKTGIYKLDYTYLKNMGVAVDAIDPRNIKIFGNGAGMLPERSDGFKYDDLEEIAIKVIGESDGRFDQQDYILFYGQDPTTWVFNNSDKLFHHITNIYTDEVSYFVTVSSGTGKRIVTKNPSGLQPEITVSTFRDYQHHELENKNLIKSGKDWWGEEFDKTVTFSFTNNFPNLIIDSDVTFYSREAARGFEPTQFNIYLNNALLATHNITAVTPDYGDNFVAESSGAITFKSPKDAIDIRYMFSKNFISSKGWIDYYELNAERKLTMVGSQMNFRNLQSVSAITQFNISNGLGKTVFDATNPLSLAEITLTGSGNEAYFVAPASALKEYIIVDGSSWLTPQSSKKIGNQNLHADGPVDMVIITQPELAGALAPLIKKRNAEGITTRIVFPEDIYNEFSNGQQDVSAIRNYMKMLYDRAASHAQMPKYLLMWGDASYDYKNRVKNNTNIAPTFESRDSYTQFSFCSDDFYGLLDDGEGADNYGGLDIAVGRLPVQNASEAEKMVAKILNYESKNSYGDWRNDICILGDDEDLNTHLQSAEDICKLVGTEDKNINVKKIFLDAYKKQIVNGVPSYPDVRDELKRVIDQGTLIVNWSGHGGTQQWAHERIFDIEEIKVLKNGNQLPLFMAATCDFGPYDDPEARTAGEMLIMNMQGGGIAFLGTTRIANTGQNGPVNLPFFRKNIFKIDSTTRRFPSMAQGYAEVKATYNGLDNFTFLGDPSQRLGVPIKKVVTTIINGKQVGSNADTLKALMHVTISGEIHDYDDNLSTDFNGVVYPTLFDKPATYQTLGNVSSSKVVNFNMQNHIVFKGKATVVNGKFTFDFIVPKDISYKWGSGKISYYANTESDEARGYYDNVIVGGTESGSVSTDKAGPDLKIYMNDERFAFGGITNENPLMLVKLFDSSGINTVGNGIGHNLTATLDGEKVFVVNDYYQAASDNFRKGEVRYPLKNLSEGKHTLNFKAWDVYNNSSEVSTEFVVAQETKPTIDHVLNYPNPFTTHTTFMFDHNQTGQPMRVHIQIMTVAGQVIKNLYSDVSEGGSHFEGITWDGLDEYGSRAGKGVYIYKVKVKTVSGEIINKVEKLVIL
jgi:hypothetical protein